MVNIEKNKKRFKILTISIWITVGFWLSMLFLSSTTNSLGRFAPLFILIQVVNSLVYLAYLGMLASDAKKNTILWVIGTFLFSTLGIGPLISYFRMKSIAVQNGWD